MRTKIKQKRAAQQRRREPTIRLPRSAFAESFCVYQDHHGKTCIVIARANHAVRFIPLTVEPVRVEQQGADRFHREWHPLYDYPVERAAIIYCAHARLFGANDDAWNWLQQIIVRVTVDEEVLPFHEKDIDMAAPQKPLRNPNFQEELQTATTARTPRTAAASTQTPPAPTRRTRASAAQANGVVTAPAKPERQPRGPTASSLFKELIMGTNVRNAQSFGWTDDEIFAEVQSQYALSDEKRSYVAWYRNDLRKKGENPPEAIKPPKAAPLDQPAAAVPTRRRQAAAPAAPAATPRTRAPRGQAAGA